jgi:hypothetical protein
MLSFIIIIKGNTMLQGKTALITGSTSGIGLASAHVLAEQGINLVLHGLMSDKEGASLYFSTMDGKFFRSGSLTPADKKGLFELVANPQKEKSAPQLFSGRLDEAGRLVLVNPAAEGGQPARITLRLLAKGDRMTMLIEQRLGKSFYSRLAEIGCTRQGSSFGKGQVFPECIVSGGRGTIEVTFEGKTYRVCCSGCKDFFEDDPQRALAEYRERQKK